MVSTARPGGHRTRWLGHQQQKLLLPTHCLSWATASKNGLTSLDTSQFESDHPWQVGSPALLRETSRRHLSGEIRAPRGVISTRSSNVNGLCRRTLAEAAGIVMRSQKHTRTWLAHSISEFESYHPFSVSCGGRPPSTLGLEIVPFKVRQGRVIEPAFAALKGRREVSRLRKTSTGNSWRGGLGPQFMIRFPFCWRRLARNGRYSPLRPAMVC
jgi:hypothetical protein